MKNPNTTIANKYIKVLEKRKDQLQHRGAPAPSRQVARYSEDPYNMTPAEYKRARTRIKKKYGEMNRAAQKKLTQAAFAAVRRKPQQWLNYREKKKKELADLETKYRRSKIDREYGNVPGEWREDERGRYPVGTQGKPKHQRGRPPSPRKPERELPSSKDIEGDWSEVPEPRGYIESPRKPSPTPRPTRRELPPPRSRGRKSLPPSRSRPAPKPERPQLPPGRKIAGYLPPAREAAKRVKSRRGNRR
jgi:hypothetical protein